MLSTTRNNTGNTEFANFSKISNIINNNVDNNCTSSCICNSVTCTDDCISTLSCNSITKMSSENDNVNVSIQFMSGEVHTLSFDDKDRFNTLCKDLIKNKKSKKNNHYDYFEMIHIINHIFECINKKINTSIVKRDYIHMYTICDEENNPLCDSFLSNIYLDYIFYKIEKNNVNINDNIMNIISFDEKYNTLLDLMKNKIYTKKLHLFVTVNTCISKLFSIGTYDIFTNISNVIYPNTHIESLNDLNTHIESLNDLFNEINKSLSISIPGYNITKFLQYKQSQCLETLRTKYIYIEENNNEMNDDDEEDRKYLTYFYRYHITSFFEEVDIHHLREKVDELFDSNILFKYK